MWVFKVTQNRDIDTEARILYAKHSHYDTNIVKVIWRLSTFTGDGRHQVTLRALF